MTLTPHPDGSFTYRNDFLDEIGVSHASYRFRVYPAEGTPTCDLSLRVIPDAFDEPVQDIQVTISPELLDLIRQQIAVASDQRGNG